MWLSGLHTPETYIAALVQAASRDKAWPLDRTTLYTKVKAADRMSSLPYGSVFLCVWLIYSLLGSSVIVCNACR